MISKERVLSSLLICLQVILLAAGLASPGLMPDSARAAEEPLEEVTATGKSILSVPDPKKEALRDAMQNAVQKAVGIQVKSDTLVQNFQVIHDRILMKSDGYVKKYEVVRERQEADAYVVEIKASIGKGSLNKDLFLNGIDVEMVYDWIGKPRIIVLVPDLVDGHEAHSTFAQAEIESLFKSKGITVLSSDQIKRIQQRDISLAFDNPQKALALGHRFGAEVVIVGKCISAFSREIAIDSFKAVFYTSMLQVKAYNTTNAEVLMSANYTEVPGETDTSALGKVDASIRSIQNVVRSNSKDIVFQVVKHWVDGMSKPKIYQVIVSGVQSSDMGKLERYLQALTGVQSVYRRSFNRGTAELEVETGIVQSTLADAIENNKAVPLELVSDEPYRLTFEKRRQH